MIRKVLVVNIILISNIVLLYSQGKKDYNFDFELPPLTNGMPPKWQLWTRANEFVVSTDSKIKQGGKLSTLIMCKKNTDKFECIAVSIPATIKGDTITVKAYMKLKDVTGTIGLLLRIDGKYAMLAFDNMMQKEINGSRDWEEYTVSLPLAEDAKTIHIGAILQGKGKLWVDNFSLWIDGKDFREAPPKEIKVPKAMIDSVEFKKGSNIIIDTLNNQQIRNLDKLGRIWGMMKYFHPAVARGEYNWDYELFRILLTITNAPTDSLADLILINWVHQFEKFDLDTQNRVISQPLKMEADFQWTQNEQLLSFPLILFLDSLRDAAKIDEHYYIDFFPSVGNPIFKNEKTYKNMAYPDAGYRLLSLFRYWNMVQYFFPYKYLIGEDWNLILSEFIPKFIYARSALEYQLAVLELITRINDTHAQIRNKEQLPALYDFYLLPFYIQIIENKAILTGIAHDKFAQESILQNGDVILKINQKSVDEIIAERKKYTPASNEIVRLRDIAHSLMHSPNPSLFIEYQRKGIIKTDTVVYPLLSSYDNIFTWGKKQSYQLLSSKIGYIYMGTLKKEKVDFVMKKFRKTKGIIIDLRSYPSDFPIYELGAYLMPKPVNFAQFTRSYLSDIGVFYFSDTVSIGKENKDYYKGKVVILVNEQTQSSAEFHAMGFRVAPNAIVIGSTTAAADGNASLFWLPGGISTLFTGIGVYYPDGAETQRIGIVPDIEIKPTIEGIRAGRDEVLEKAIEWIKLK
jgi:C-terminal processing protease CtpA/Prc